MINISKSLRDNLTYSTKLSCDSEFIEKLLQDGQAQATAFLTGLRGGKESAPAAGKA